MTPEELKTRITNLLYDLHAMNKLNLYILKCIESNFEIDAKEICREEGITYDL